MMRNRFSRKLEAKRMQRVNRLIQLFGLLERRNEIDKIWGWKARRRIVHSLARGVPCTTTS